MRASSRVIINTISQYLRSVILIIVTFWTSRVVLGNLGVIDYGIYSLVGGVVAMLGFLRLNLAETTQRYLSYYSGNNDDNYLRQIFNNSLISHLIIGIIICFFLFLFSSFIIREILNVPSNRINASFIVFYLMIVNLFFYVQGIPYHAVLIARENIVFSSFVTVLDALMKIPIAYSISMISANKLEWFATMTILLAVANFFVFFIYCTAKYKECRCFSFSSFNGALFKEMFYFTGWNMYGTVCMLVRREGIAVLLNNFFSVSVNASFSIGHKVIKQIEVLAMSLIISIRPQLIKAGSIKDRSRMFRLAEIGSKYSFLLMSVITIPLAFNINEILSLWLVNVPDHTDVFCIGFIVTIQLIILTASMNAVNQAVGNVKDYNIFVNTVRIVILPIAYFSLKYGATIIFIMFLYSLSEAISSILRVLFIHKDTGYSLSNFYENVLTPVMLPIAVNIFVSGFLSRLFTGWSIIFIGIFSFFVTLAVLGRGGIEDDEKEIIKGFAGKIMTLVKMR